MNSPITTLREYGEYLESLDRPLDIDELVARDTQLDAVVELDASEPRVADATVVELAISRHARARRRQRLIAAVAAAAVVISVTVLVETAGDEEIRLPARSVTSVPGPSTNAPSNVGFDTLLSTEGVTPSTPRTGELVAAVYRSQQLGVYFVFDDGRLIWLDDVLGTQRWVERRLTPEGVERVRSEIFATGFFDPGQPRLQVASSSRDGMRLCVCVRDGDRILVRGARDLQASAPQVLEHLGTLPFSLPATMWADLEPRAYVPSKYAVCFFERGDDGRFEAPPDSSRLLNLLPSRAAKLLDGRHLAQRPYNPSLCVDVRTANARVLANALVSGFRAWRFFGPDEYQSKYGFEIQADINRPKGTQLSIQFYQLFPDGALAYFGG